MKREPTILYIFRLLLNMGIFFLIAMLYWSSTIIEKKLIQIESKVNSRSPIVLEKPIEKKDYQSLADPTLPNLLEEDPFYKTTLPGLLGANFHPHGIRYMAALGRPKNLHPFSNWRNVSSWNSACIDTVAHQKFGIYETQSPGLALKMEERSPGEFWIFLRPDIYWEPISENLFNNRLQLADHFKQKHLVTAHDFKFYFDALMNPYVQEAGAVSLRNYLGDIETIEVIDNFTFVVRWKGNPKIPYIAKQMTGSLQPLARFVYQYFPNGEKIIEEDIDYRKNSVWAQNFTEHWAKNIIVSCGPWIFDGMSDKQIKFQRNPHYWEKLGALVQEQKIAIKENPDSIWQDFKAGKLDTYTLQPDQLIEWNDFKESDEYQKQLNEGNAIEQLDYLTRSYVYIGWNEKSPLFDHKEMRKAMTLAIDRKRIINTILNGMGVEITGPFAISSPSNDSTIKPLPFSPSRARRLLEKQGWFDTDGDGIRDKVIDGKKVLFRFKLTYYVKNPTTKAICSYVATALKEIGVDCQLHGVDISDLSNEFDEKSFDAVCLGWALGTPPEEPKQLWHSLGATEKGSSNAIGFHNKVADQLIEKLRFESNKEKRIKLYHQFHQLIHSEQPYTFLYTPKAALLYRQYLKNVFIPADKQELIPGANVDQPQSQIFYIEKDV